MNKNKKKRKLAVIGVAAALGILAACTSRKMYPDSAPGWHAAGYATVFGRLQRVPSPNPDDPASWIIRYGFTSEDSYGGKFNLTPAAKMVGYNGGELVEIRGHLAPEMAKPDISGAWYQVESIRLWAPTKPQ